MKDKYLSPDISIEILEKTDVLTSSGDDPIRPRLMEKENVYREIVSFFGSGAWF